LAIVSCGEREIAQSETALEAIVERKADGVAVSILGDWQRAVVHQTARPDFQLMK
jgi:hypothetical protein